MPTDYSPFNFQRWLLSIHYLGLPRYIDLNSPPTTRSNYVNSWFNFVTFDDLRDQDSRAQDLWASPLFSHSLRKRNSSTSQSPTQHEAPRITSIEMPDDSLRSYAAAHNFYQQYTHILDSTVTFTRDVAGFLKEFNLHYVLFGVSGLYAFILNMYNAASATNIFECKSPDQLPHDFDEFTEMFWSIISVCAVFAMPGAINQFKKMREALEKYARTPSQSLTHSSNPKLEKFLKKISPVTALWFIVTTGFTLQRSIFNNVDESTSAMECLRKNWEFESFTKTVLAPIVAVAASLGMAGPQVWAFNRGSRTLFSAEVTALLYTLFIMLGTLMPLIIQLIKKGLHAYSNEALVLLLCSTILVATNRFKFYLEANREQNPGRPLIRHFESSQKKSPHYKLIGLLSSLTGNALLGYIVYNSMRAVLENLNVSEPYLNTIAIFIATNEALSQNFRSLGAWFGKKQSSPAMTRTTYSEIDPNQRERVDERSALLPKQNSLNSETDYYVLDINSSNRSRR